MITIRIDVDYPYPSRVRSFMYTAMNMKLGRDYLKNSKAAARMINDSRKEVRAYWFFTVKTIPNAELLKLIDNSKHEVGLHVVNEATAELKTLEAQTGRKINFYTIHGTERLLGRVMWRRFRSSSPKIPSDFPLQSFHKFPTIGIDSLCYAKGTDSAVQAAQEQIAAGGVIYFHPIWLFQRGKMNRRGPCFEALKRILQG